MQMLHMVHNASKVLLVQQSENAKGNCLMLLAVMYTLHAFFVFCTLDCTADEC